jgi:hypothetical protein
MFSRPRGEGTLPTSICKEQAMNAMQRNALMFALTAALALPVPAADEPAARQPAPAAQAATGQRSEISPPAGMPAMRARMEEMRRTQDPARRAQLMEEQMKQMEAMTRDGGMPPGMGMMRRDPACRMEKCDMAAAGKACAMGGTGGDELLARRMDLLEQRMDLMQMMMRMTMGHPRCAPEMPGR